MRNKLFLTGIICVLTSFMSVNAQFQTAFGIITGEKAEPGKTSTYTIEPNFEPLSGAMYTYLKVNRGVFAGGRSHLTRINSVERKFDIAVKWDSNCETFDYPWISVVYSGYPDLNIDTGEGFLRDTDKDRTHGPTFGTLAVPLKNSDLCMCKKLKNGVATITQNNPVFLIRFTKIGEYLRIPENKEFLENNPDCNPLESN